MSALGRQWEVAQPRVLLLMSTRTYKARAFLEAARRLGVGVVVGSELRAALASRAPDTNLALPFARPDRAVRKIVDVAEQRPFDAIVGVDDDTVLMAAQASAALGLPHNPVEAVRTTRDKYRLRRALAIAGLPAPHFVRLSVAQEPQAAASRVPYPCVLKPVGLSASRGVIRADDQAQFVDAFQRLAAMLESDGPASRHVLVESFIPGPEVALEGLLVRGHLQTLALFDKPDPLDGPYFEETLYVTPSRLPGLVRGAIADTTARATAALGLRHGPIHAELRLGEGGPWVIEVAARSIGGLCSNALRFGTGLSLEEVILRHAIGAEVHPPERERQAAGAMMLPIPKAGVLRAVRGREQAEQVPGVEEVAISIPLGQPVVPLPEGDRYLGFVFGRAKSPEEVERALREAHRRLEFVIADAETDLDEADWLRAAPVSYPLPLVQAPSSAGTGPNSPRKHAGREEFS